MNLIDKNGLWSTGWHNEIISSLLGGGNNPMIKVYQNASYVVDQDQKHQNKHGMADYGQSYLEAYNGAIDYITNNLYNAMQSNSQETAAMYIGFGWHTLMDITSPVHGFDKEYHGSSGFWSGLLDLVVNTKQAWNGIKHTAQETTDDFGPTTEQMGAMHTAMAKYMNYAQQNKSKFANGEIKYADLEEFVRGIVNNELETIGK